MQTAALACHTFNTRKRVTLQDFAAPPPNHPPFPQPQSPPHPHPHRQQQQQQQQQPPRAAATNYAPPSDGLGAPATGGPTKYLPAENFFCTAATGAPAAGLALRPVMQRPSQEKPTCLGRCSG